MFFFVKFSPVQYCLSSCKIENFDTGCCSQLKVLKRFLLLLSVMLRETGKFIAKKRICA